MNTPVGNTPPAPDPTPPTVAITSPATNSAVFNLVTITADASDNMSVAGVRFFVDGQALGAEVIAPPYSILWDTTGSLGSHTITAVARDLANNSTTSAAVPITVIAATPAVVGQWAAPFSWPIVAVHAHLLPTGEVLTSDGQTAGNKYVYEREQPQHEPFLRGPLPSGRWANPVAGGHIAGHTGVKDTNIFDATTHQWSRAPILTARRVLGNVD